MLVVRNDEVVPSDVAEGGTCVGRVTFQESQCVDSVKISHGLMSPTASQQRQIT
jgi:hypothetical protein